MDKRGSAIGMLVLMVGLLLLVVAVGIAIFIVT